MAARYCARLLLTVVLALGVASMHTLGHTHDRAGEAVGGLAHMVTAASSAVAESRATDAEIKQIASAVKAAQQPEIATMTGWLAAWGKPTPMPGAGHDMPGMSSMPGEMSEQDMAKLAAASGTEFDRMFALMMIAHHNGAIQMARDVQANGSNPQSKRVATQIEKTQAAEVTTLQKIVDRL